MNLKLIWTNINTVPITTEIYRGDQPLDRAALGSPLVVLTDQQTEWIDTTVENGKLYYYVFVTITANDRNVSTNYPIRAIPRRGPGPIELLYGDYDIGYFGMVESIDFINTAQLLNKLNFRQTNGNPWPIVTYGPQWMKYARQGKIYMVPRQSLVSGVSWKVLYDNGLVFGINGPGPYKHSTSAEVNQQRIVQIGPDRFIVRLMKGYLEDVSSGIVPAGVVDQPTGISEWSDFIYAQGKNTPVAQRIPNVAPALDGGLAIVSTNGAWCQETSGNNSSIVRGSSMTGTTIVSPQWMMYRSSRAMDNTAGCWIPVLELIEE